MKKKIEETRQRLNEAIEEHVSLEKVLELSRELDFLVEQYMEESEK
ncbi:MAG: Spo0E family sporulation regulatory protein-aspartic acid phosphatase [Lachnospiraceae bacterium]|nr:Spo0E family sporulation regulatory protein-aspartic acid phosphatase [Lachnospiraceae bacterium]